MKIENTGGLVTISLSEKDAKAFAIMVLCAVDNQETMEAEQLGVSVEELELCVRICEAMNDEFAGMGFHKHIDHNEDPEDEMDRDYDPDYDPLDYSDDPAFAAFEMNNGDRQVVVNLRVRWGKELADVNDKTLAYTYREFSLSDINGYVSHFACSSRSLEDALSKLLDRL